MQTQFAQRSSTLFAEITQRLKAGEIIILPTDTVYVLVVNAYHQEAVNQLLKLKSLSSPQPFAILTRKEKADEVVNMTPAATQMMSHFPYPVTMILSAKNTLPPEVTQGFKNIFVACPDRFIYDLIEAVPFPMACTSATLAAGTKTTSFEIARQLFDGKVSLIVDGGKSKYARGGTMIDFTVDNPTIMSFGPVSADDIRPLLPEIVLPSHLMK